MTNRAFLRETSATAHRLAENAWLSDGRFSGRDRYFAWLETLRQAHAYIAMPANAVIAPVEGCAEERARLRAFAHDLDTYRSPAPQVACCPDYSWAWGACYAINGSALGAAAMIRRGLLEDDWPVAYVTHMADYARSGMLAGFLRDLDRQVLDLEAARKGTLAVFAALSEPERFRRMVA